MSKLNALASALVQQHSAAEAAGDKGNVQTSKYSGPPPSIFPVRYWDQQLQHIQDLQCSAVQCRTFSFSALQLDIVSQHLGPTAHLGTIDFILKVEEMTPALNAVQGVCHSTCHTKMATEELWW